MVGRIYLSSIADLERAIRETLTESPDDYDTWAIAEALQERYDLVGEEATETLDDIDPEEYWTIVWIHEIAEEY